MDFNCEGQNGGNNGGTMMYNYGLENRDLCVQFLVLTIPFSTVNILYHIWWNLSCEGQNEGNNGGIMMCVYGLDHVYLCGKFWC